MIPNHYIFVLFTLKIHLFFIMYACLIYVRSPLIRGNVKYHSMQVQPDCRYFFFYYALISLFLTHFLYWFLLFLSLIISSFSTTFYPYITYKNSFTFLKCKKCDFFTSQNISTFIDLSVFLTILILNSFNEKLSKDWFVMRTFVKSIAFLRYIILDISFNSFPSILYQKIFSKSKCTDINLYLRSSLYFS